MKIILCDKPSNITLNYLKINISFDLLFMTMTKNTSELWISKKKKKMVEQKSQTPFGLLGSHRHIDKTKIQRGKWHINSV